MKTRLFLAGLFLSSSLATSALAAPLSASATRDLPTGLERISIVFQEDRVELVLNSNFMNPGAKPARLGVFKMPKTGKWIEHESLLKAEAEKLANRIAVREKMRLEGPSQSPHRTRLELGVNEVPISEVYLRDAIEALLAKSLEDPSWKPVKGVTPECRAKFCHVQDFGVIYRE